LFAACRAGTVDVLIGSTEKMGVGTNVQFRAIALHHLDCPWRPADVAQREGRILRQGNHNPEVQIIRYATERSFDGFMWQAVERKSRFIGQVMRGRLDVREIEDIGDAALSYNEVKALATGNPLLMEKAEADAVLTKLWRAERAYQRNQDALARTAASSEQRIGTLTTLCEQIADAITRRTDTRGDAFTMTIDSTRHTRRHDAGQHLARHLASQLAALSRSDHPRLTSQPGRLGGFDLAVTVHRALGKAEAVIAFDGAPGIDLRLSADDVASADPGKLAVRLENRLASLESQRGRHLAEIDRLRSEAEHARADLGQAFPQAQQLAQARERYDDIEGQLREAARPSADPVPDSQPGAGGKPQGSARPEPPAAREREGPQQLTRHSFPAPNPLAHASVHPPAPATSAPAPTHRMAARHAP